MVRRVRNWRALIVIPTLGGGGAERTAVALANRLAEEGEVLVATFSPGPVFFDLHPNVKRYSLLGQDERRQTRNLTLLFSLKRLIRKERPDVCLGYSFQAAILTAFATLGTPAKSILCERSDPARYPLIQRLIAKVLWWTSDGAVYQSQYAAESYRTRRRSVILPNFLEDSILRPVAIQRQPYILFVGRLEAAKDPLSALEAFGRIAPEFPGLKLVMVGNGSLKHSLEDWAMRHGLESRVFFPGIVSDVGAHYQQARALICASIVEGYPNALLEALAMGVPVVVVDAPTFTQRALVSLGSGILVAPGDLPGLADALKTVLTEADFLTQAIIRSQEIRHSHASENVVRDWISYVDEVLL